MNLAHLLLRSARTAGERPAIYLGTELLHDYADAAPDAPARWRARSPSSTACSPATAWASS